MSEPDLTPDQVYVLKYLYKCQQDGERPRFDECGLPPERVADALAVLKELGFVEWRGGN